MSGNEQRPGGWPLTYCVTCGGTAGWYCKREGHDHRQTVRSYSRPTVEATFHKRTPDHWSIDVLDITGSAILNVPADGPDDGDALHLAAQLAESLTWNPRPVPPVDDGRPDTVRSTLAKNLRAMAANADCDLDRFMLNEAADWIDTVSARWTGVQAMADSAIRHEREAKRLAALLDAPADARPEFYGRLVCASCGQVPAAHIGPVGNYCPPPAHPVQPQPDERLNLACHLIDRLVREVDDLGWTEIAAHTVQQMRDALASDLAASRATEAPPVAPADPPWVCFRSHCTPESGPCNDLTCGRGQR